MDKAVHAARRAFESGPWPRMNPSARGKLVRKLADALWERREEFALVGSLENGKTFREAVRGDVAPGSATLAYASEWSNKLAGEVLPVDGTFLTYVLREPLGVVAAIVPWNYPTCLACWKLGPALATGCTVILKPSELTPLTAMKLGELAREVGFPPGRAQRAPGLRRARRRGAGPPPGRGQDRLHRLDPHRPPAAARLGGHQSEEAVAGAGRQEPADHLPRRGLGPRRSRPASGASSGTRARSATPAAGCWSTPERYDAFVESSPSARTEDGGRRPAGPAHRDGRAGRARTSWRPSSATSSPGRSEGATLACGRRARHARGPRRRATSSGPRSSGTSSRTCGSPRRRSSARCSRVLRFDDEAQALEVANGTQYGLAASIWTRDVARAHALAKKVKAGVVWINCFNEFDDAAPFGGYKESGWGRDLSAPRARELHPAQDGLDARFRRSDPWPALPVSPDAPRALRRRSGARPSGRAGAALARREGRDPGEDRRGRPRRRARGASTSPGQVRLGGRGRASASATSSSAGTSPTSSTTTPRSPAGTPATPTSRPGSTSPPRG